MEHKKLWYLLIFMISILLATLICGALETQATDISKSLIINNGLNNSDMAWCREKTGRQWVFSCIQDGSGHANLIGTYSDDDWDTWANITIADNWQSATYINPRTAMVTSNNSIILFVMADKPGVNAEWDFWIHYPTAELDDWWEVTIISYSGGWSYFNPRAAINDTDIVLFVYNGPTGIEYKTFAFRTLTLSTYVTWGAGISSAPFVASNSTGVFWIMYYLAISFYHVRDLAKTYDHLVGDDTFGMDTFTILNNDKKFMSAHYHNPVSSYVVCYYESSFGTYSSYVEIEHTSVWLPEHTSSFVSVTSQNKVSVYWENYRNHRLELAGPCDYDSTDVTWQASVRTVTNFGDSKPFFPKNGAQSLWPKSSSMDRTEIPSEGWIIPLADDNNPTYNKMLVYNSTISFVAYSAPSITTTSITSAYTSETYAFHFTVSGGNTPYIWSIANGPAWWNLNASSGWVYGIAPSSTGSISVTMRVMDTYGSVATRTWTFSVTTRPSGESTESNWVWPSLGEDAELWFLLAGISLTACIIGTIRNLASRGRKHRKRSE